MFSPFVRRQTGALVDAVKVTPEALDELVASGEMMRRAGPPLIYVMSRTDGTGHYVPVHFDWNEWIVRHNGIVHALPAYIFEENYAQPVSA